MADFLVWHDVSLRATIELNTTNLKKEAIPW